MTTIFYDCDDKARIGKVTFEKLVVITRYSLKKVSPYETSKKIRKFCFLKMIFIQS